MVHAFVVRSDLRTTADWPHDCVLSQGKRRKGGTTSTFSLFSTVHSIPTCTHTIINHRGPRCVPLAGEECPSEQQTVSRILIVHRHRPDSEGWQQQHRTCTSCGTVLNFCRPRWPSRPPSPARTPRLTSFEREGAAGRSCGRAGRSSSWWGRPCRRVGWLAPARRGRFSSIDHRQPSVLLEKELLIDHSATGRHYIHLPLRCTVRLLLLLRPLQPAVLAGPAHAGRGRYSVPGWGHLYTLRDHIHTLCRSARETVSYAFVDAFILISKREGTFRGVVLYLSKGKRG